MKKRILIVRIDRIGDVVLTTSLPREIKKKYPDSFVAVLVRSYTKDIFLENPFIDEIIIADEMLNCSKMDVLKFSKQISSYNFTHSFLILPNEKINYILFFAGIKHRYGTGHKFYQFITGTKGISRNKYIPLRHEADYCMDFVRKLGIETNNINPQIFLSEEEKIYSLRIKQNLLFNNEAKYLIGIHSGSGNSAPNWKTEIYKQLILELTKRNHLKIVVTDNKIPQEIKNLENVSYLNEGVELRESIKNISILDCLISASTGPLHIAAGLSVKTVSVFCPLTACSPKLWGPLGNNGQVILPSEKYCKNFCPLDPKKCHYEGEEGLKIESVLEKIDKLFIK
ncbi:MAG: glycosyltransferase family 9 protein [bacterium]